MNLLATANEVLEALEECKRLSDRLFTVEAGLMDQFDILLLEELIHATNKTRDLITGLESLGG